MSQLSIEGTGIPTPPETRLTKRQRFALELIGQLGYMTSEELGASLHEYRGAHPATRTCTFCRPEGAHMGASLREKGLVRMKRDRGWYVVGLEAPRPSGPSAQLGPDDDLPF